MLSKEFAWCPVSLFGRTNRPVTWGSGGAPPPTRGNSLLTVNAAPHKGLIVPERAETCQCAQQRAANVQDMSPNVHHTSHSRLAHYAPTLTANTAVSTPPQSTGAKNHGNNTQRSTHVRTRCCLAQGVCSAASMMTRPMGWVSGPTRTWAGTAHLPTACRSPAQQLQTAHQQECDQSVSRDSKSWFRPPPHPNGRSGHS